MLVPIDWLGEYAALPTGATGAQVAADLVRVGLEEEGISGGDLTGPLVVGRVLTQEPEPQKNGKTINWCTVDVGAANGTGEPQGIVCGARNFGVGDFVVVVLPGAELPGGFAISARKTYGHVSAGMICSAAELGLPDDGSDGIIVLAELLGEAAKELQPGQDAITLLGLDRETIEVNITPDRGYCFSIRGIAREYAHATGATFTDPVDGPGERAPEGNDAGFPIRLQDDAPLRGRPGCDRYVARIVRGLDPQAPSPRWMQTWLSEAGMRPISLAVDVTNFVMLALGQPLHAFDAAKLTGPIVVRRARDGERLTTLDDVDRALSPEDLLITDTGATPLAIAGVMGGASSEVSAATADVLIEAAHFDQQSTARSSRRHRLSTEASRRFERGVDPQIAAAAAQLAVELLTEYGGGTVDPGVTDVGEPQTPEPIRLERGLPRALVGVDYEPKRVEQILREIGCAVEESENHLLVTPPSWRPDLTIGPDLAEEVARIDGYHKIPSILPTPPGGRGLTHDQRVRRLVANLLAAQGLSEVISPPFVGEKVFDALAYESSDRRRAALRLTNPLSDEEPLLRTSLLATLLQVVRRNVTRGNADVALFEIGQVTTGAQTPTRTYDVGVYPGPDAVQEIIDAVPTQPRHLGFVLSGEVERSGWWGPGRPADWSDSIAVARAIAEALAVEIDVTAHDEAPYHPGRCAVVSLADGTRLGVVGELHPKVVQALKLPLRTVAGELDLGELVRASETVVSATTLPHHPTATSDVALVVAESVSAVAVERSLRAGAGELLESVRLFDTYSGDQLPDGQRSLAFRLTFRAPDRTLKTDEVNRLRDAAVAAAQADHAATQRA